MLCSRRDFPLQPHSQMPSEVALLPHLGESCSQCRTALGHHTVGKETRQDTE